MKKKKRSLTKEQRDALLRSLAISTTYIQSTQQSDHGSSHNLTPTRGVKDTPSLTTTAELKRIGVVFSIIILILVATILIDHNTSYLASAGTFLSQRLGL